MSSEASSPAATDTQDAPAFICAGCKLPLTASDFGEFGLRTPDYGETVDDYCDAELLDPRELRHLACLTREAEAPVPDRR